MKIVWTCSECGTEIPVEFTATIPSALTAAYFVCPACGADELAQERSEVLSKALQGVDENLLDPAFPALARSIVDKQIKTRFLELIPGYSGIDKWDRYNLFDIIIIAYYQPKALFELPLENLAASGWNAIWPYCQKLLDVPSWANEIICSFQPEYAIDKLSDPSLRSLILSYYPFEQLDTDEWLHLLQTFKENGEEGETRLFKALFEGWDALHFLPQTLNAVISKNPSSLNMIPAEKLSPEMLIFLLPRLEDGGVFAERCPLEKLTPDYWLALLSNPRTWTLPNINAILERCNARTILSRGSIIRIVQRNPCAATYFGLDDLPLDDVITLYLEHPEFCGDAYSIFLRCNNRQAMVLLSGAQDCLPACTAAILQTSSPQHLSRTQISDLLEQNLAIGRYLPAERIAELDTETFLVFAYRFKGADFWMAPFDLNRLKSEQLTGLVKEFPWLASRIDLDGWSFDDLRDLFTAIPSLWRGYHRKMPYLIYHHRKLALSTLVLFFFLLLSGLFVFVLNYCGGPKSEAEKQGTISGVELSLTNNAVAEIERSHPERDASSKPSRMNKAATSTMKPNDIVIGELTPQGETALTTTRVPQTNVVTSYRHGKTDQTRNEKEDMAFADEQYAKGQAAHAAGRDAEAALFWRKAAETGHVNAKTKLGLLYAKGSPDVPRDYAEAFAWILGAASVGEPSAEYNLGCMYELGLGTSKNMDEAITWYRRAAAHGHAKAKKRLEDMDGNNLPLSTNHPCQRLQDSL